jgi:Beta-lactamase enzyme family
MDALLERWRASARRSRARRRPPRGRRDAVRALFGAAAAAVILVVALATAPSRIEGVAASLIVPGPTRDASALELPSLGSTDEAGRQGGRKHKVPSAAALRKARDFAGARAGLVSFATVNSDGKLRGDDVHRLYPAASTVKAMLLAAELRRIKRDGGGIDSETDSLLEAMITASDNDAADAIYARVGDEGMSEVAKRAGMPDFTVAGHWGNAQVSAADLALLFGDLDRVLARKFREYGKGLLGSVIPSQRWGIADVVGDRWAIRFKGGWLPDHALAHQAAELRERDGNRDLSIAVLTDDQPSFDYAIESVRGVGQRLLDLSR